jgi:hypothetical protein
MLARAAYWPRLPISRQFDAAWYTSGFADALHPNVLWLDAAEDWNDWSIGVPRARDCHDHKIIARRTGRHEQWRFARNTWGIGQRMNPWLEEPLPLSDAVVARWTPLIDAIAAGLFYYWIGVDEIVCVPRPALWFERDRLHRADGPAVSWSTGEAHYFWQGVEVPRSLIEQPETLTLHRIHGEENLELRRCMIEIFGQQRFLHEGGARLVAEDAFGKLWEPDESMRSTHLLLEVTNGTTEPDGTRRVYFLRVPPEMRSVREAVAWTYGLSAERYDVARRVGKGAQHRISTGATNIGCAPCPREAARGHGVRRARLCPPYGLRAKRGNGRCGALLPLFRLVGVPCTAALWRVASLLRHRSDRP